MLPSKDQAVAVAVLAGTAIAVYVLWKAKEGAAAVVETARGVVTQDLNPASDRNLIYRGVNAVGGAIAASFRLPFNRLRYIPRPRSTLHGLANLC